MSLTGTLATMPLDDLLRWIAARRKTGSLALQDAENTTHLFLKDGRVISSASTDPRLFLGQFLLAQTNLSEEQLRHAFERQEKTRVYLGKNIYIKTLLGKILLEEKLLEEAEITRVLRLKAEESIYDVFLWSEGSFELSVGELPPEELIPIALDIAEVLKRGRERWLRWQAIQARIPSPNATFVVHSDRIPSSARLDAAARRLLVLLGGGRSLREAMLELHCTEYAVASQIDEFLSQGYLSLDRDAPLTAPPLRDPPLAGAPADALVERGLELFDQRAYADTVVAARQALRENPLHVEARKLLERSERELTDSFYARLFSPDDVPVLQPDAPTAGARPLSPEERFLLERVNGSWPIRSLVKLSPLREVDALAVFKRLLEQGLIRIERRPPH